MNTQFTQRVQMVLIGGLIGILLAAGFEMPAAAAGQKFILVSGVPKDQGIGKWGYLVFDEAFRRLGMELDYQVYPPKRATELAVAGEVDGEVARHAQYAETYPSMVRVDEVIISMKQVAFAKDPLLKLENWDSLKGTNYRVDYRRGEQISEVRLPPVVKPENLNAVTDHIQGLKKLAAGRTDIYVGPADTVAPLLQTAEFKDAGIHMAGVLEEILSYPYVHQKHADLAPKLAAVLKQMKAEGLFEQYLKQVMVH